MRGGKIRKILLGLMLVAFALGSPAVAVAHPGHAEHDRSVQTTTNEAGAAQNKTEERAEASKFRAQGQELLTQLRKDRQEQTKQQRQEKCQTRKQGLQTKVDRLTVGAQKHKARIDDVLTKVTTYQQQHNLNIENFEMLMSDATAAKAAAENSVTALGSLKPTVDCNNESVASDVAAFKVAATQARSDLSEYRQAVKAILKAVKTAKNGGDQ